MEGGPADPVPGERVLVPGGGAGGASGVGGRLLLRKPLLAQPGLAHHPDAGGDDAPVLMGYEVSNGVGILGSTTRMLSSCESRTIYVFIGLLHYTS